MKRRTAVIAIGCSALAGVGAVLGVATLGAGGLVAVLGPGWAWQSSVRAALAGVTGGEADFASVELRDDGAVVTGLTVTHPVHGTVLSAERLDVKCDPTTLATATWQLDHVVVEGLSVVLREDGDALALPPSTWDLVFGEGSVEAPAVHIDAVELREVRFEGHGRNGTVRGHLAQAGASGVALASGTERPLLVERAFVAGVHSTWDGRNLLDLGRVDLDPDGVATLSELDGTAALQASGWPVWPPLIELAAPKWAGGRGAYAEEAAEAAWFGLAPETWPWTPSRLTADGRLVLVDRFMATRPATWVLSGVQIDAHPDSGNIAFASRASTASGGVVATGRVRPTGRVEARVVARDLDAAAFDPYLAINLAKLGVAIREGTLSGEGGVSLTGSVFRSDGVVTLREVRFERTSAFSGLNKALLTSASWLIGGADKEFHTEVSVNGDFDDPRFSPLRQLAADVSKGIVADAGRRVGKGVGTVKDRASKLWKSVFD